MQYGRELGKLAALLLSVQLGGCPGEVRVETPVGVLHEDGQAAIDRCRLAQEQLPGLATEARYQSLARGCGELFSLPLCREAVLLSSRARPELRARMIAVACQSAYCQLFAEPAPPFCGLRAASVSPSELSAGWRPFALAVLALELGLEEGDPRGSLLATSLDLLMLEPVTVEEPPTVRGQGPGASPVLSIQLGRDGPEFTVGASLEGGERFGPWSLPLAPDAGDLAGLLEAALRAAAGGSAVLEVEPSVSYSVVISLMDALRQGGIEAVSLSTASTEDAQSSP